MGDLFRLSVASHIDSAHYIQDYAGKCQNLHGHRWDIEVVLSGTKLGSMNMLIDFANVKSLLKLITDYLDHQTLNDVLAEPNLTAEFMARWIYGQLEERMKEAYGIALRTPPSLVCVRVWESPKCCVEYSVDG